MGPETARKELQRLRTKYAEGYDSHDEEAPALITDELAK